MHSFPTEVKGMTFRERERNKKGRGGWGVGVGGGGWGGVWTDLLGLLLTFEWNLITDV